MNTKQVNYLNIGLMILSAAIAFVIPFELFLFSYAFLGPLHYLTEISWLHKRKYFSAGKRDYWFLIALTFIILFPSLFQDLYQWIGPKDDHGNPSYTPEIINFLRPIDQMGTSLIFIAFAGAAAFVLVRGTTRKFIAFSLILLIAFAFRQGKDQPYDQYSQSAGFLTFSVFLPTLIHVFVFTGAFILVGALKSKSTSGYLSIIVFLVCAVSLFLVSPGLFGYKASEYAISSYKVSFQSLNETIFKSFLHVKNPDENTIYFSGVGILITRFIAYAYTYHYLNWFSKTSIIKWHEISRKGLVIIFVLWAIAIGLYYYDYKTGLEALLFLSFLHVILEFPLNFQTFKQIGEQVKGRFSPAKT